MAGFTRPFAVVFMLALNLFSAVAKPIDVRLSAARHPA